MNIVLTGLRGSGKTEIGKILSRKLNWEFVDTDEEIEEAVGKKISEIVELRGWEYFRAKENEIIKEVSDLDKTVISAGGGAILDHDNEKELKKNGKIVYLYVKPEICAKRILGSKNRPPLTNKESIEEEIKELYKQRNHRYCKSANLIFHRTEDLEKDSENLIEKLVA